MKGTTDARVDSQITFCYTRDLVATARFYEEVLGLEVVLEQAECRVYRVTDTAFLGFCERPDAPRPAGVMLTLVLDDVDGWFARLSAQGVAFSIEPTHNERYRIYQCVCEDPNGYAIEIQRFEDPRWPPPGGREA